MHESLSVKKVHTSNQYNNLKIKQHSLNVMQFILQRSNNIQPVYKANNFINSIDIKWRKNILLDKIYIWLRNNFSLYITILKFCFWNTCIMYNDSSIVRTLLLQHSALIMIHGHPILQVKTHYLISRSTPGISDP